METKNQTSHRFLVNSILTALFAAVLAALAPWSIPIGDIPISLATLGVYLVGGALGTRRGTLSVLLYLCLGAIGLPVFSAFRGGIGVLLGFTGGYLVGYLPCVAVTGLSRGKRLWLFPVMAVAGTLACYALGTVWYMILSGVPLGAALLTCVVPFLPLDALKIAVATALMPALRRALARFLPTTRTKTV